MDRRKAEGTDEIREDQMLQAWGIYSALVGFAMVVWFIHVGFLVKKVLKEQRETNRLLQQLANAGSPKSV